MTVSVDHYHSYKEDIVLMAEMGFKAYRFLIFWSCVIPQGTEEPKPEGLEFYSNLIDECLKYDIQPIITMFHFDMPSALDDRGSCGNRDSVNWFVDYAKLLFENYGDRVKYWLTFNEQNILTMVGPVIGTLRIPEGTENETKDMFLGVSNEFLPKTEFGWEIGPICFRVTLREINSRYHLPILITENGLGAYDELTEDGKIQDQYRINYLRVHIGQMGLAINDGIDMLGYCPWSAIDLISTNEGIRKRYGFIYVDRDRRCENTGPLLQRFILLVQTSDSK